MKQNEERLDNWERKAQILRERYLEERKLERIQRMNILNYTTGVILTSIGKEVNELNFVNVVV